MTSSLIFSLNHRKKQKYQQMPNGIAYSVYYILAHLYHIKNTFNLMIDAKSTTIYSRFWRNRSTSCSCRGGPTRYFETPGYNFTDPFWCQLFEWLKPSIQIVLIIRYFAEKNQSLNLLQWDGVSMPVQAKTKRLQKIFPFLVFWSVCLGMKFLQKIITQSVKLVWN